ncbi:MAG: TetR family transcriptional regulator [Alphaproteobacteria bacterium]|nr:TetR family transcriptional regulator [Alphaproteobacteria bacterium]
MAALRLNREQQVERNRAALLAAARHVFLAKGYAGASLDAITAESGFSKGVVYSQFASKGDLFLALLEERIAQRAAQNEKVAAGLSGAAGVAALIRAGSRDSEAEPGWAQLLVEFRAQAARDPELNARYAALHNRTLERLEKTLAALHARAGRKPRRPLRVMAELILAFATGIPLERAVRPNALPEDHVKAMLIAAFGLSD